MRAMFSVVQRAGYDAVGFLIDCPPAGQADDCAYVHVIEEFIAAIPGAGAARRSSPRCRSRSRRRRARSVLRRASCRCRGSARRSRRSTWPARSASAGRAGPRWSCVGRTCRVAQPCAGRARGRRKRSPPSACACRARGWCAYRKPQLPPRRSVFRSSSRPPAPRSSTSPTSAAWCSTCAAPPRPTAAARAPGAALGALLVEEMVADGVAEILIGITVDPQFGQLLVLGAGGVLTELLRDIVTLLPPFTAAAIEAALSGCAWRSCSPAIAAGRPPMCRRWWRPRSPAPATRRPISTHSPSSTSIRSSCGPRGQGAVAVDALIRLTE